MRTSISRLTKAASVRVDAAIHWSITLALPKAVACAHACAVSWSSDQLPQTPGIAGPALHTSCSWMRCLPLIAQNAAWRPPFRTMSDAPLHSWHPLRTAACSSCTQSARGSNKAPGPQSARLGRLQAFVGGALQARHILHQEAVGVVPGQQHVAHDAVHALCPAQAGLGFGHVQAWHAGPAAVRPGLLCPAQRPAHAAGVRCAAAAGAALGGQAQ